MSRTNLVSLSTCCACAAFLLGAQFQSNVAEAGMMAARIAITGTLADNSDTNAVVTVKTAGPSLHVATDPKNLGDITLLTGASTVAGGGVPFKQANGVIIATPNQFQYTAVGQRNMVETPGELSATVPGGFPSGMWLSTTNVSGAGNEANFRLGMAYFPFAEGWVAGHINGADGTFRAGNSAGVTVTPLPSLPTAAFGTGHYKLQVAGVDSRVAGMLFAMSERNSSSGNVVPVGALADGSGWDIRINDQGASFPTTEQADWSFVYIPYTAGNLYAAGEIQMSPITNSTAPPDFLNIRQGINLGNWSVSRVDLGPNGSIAAPGTPDGNFDAGRLLITIPGKTDLTGYLMVGVSKLATLNNIDFGADDNFLAWEYNATLGGFLVDNMDLDGAILQNSDIYFAYFDYANPIIPVPEPATVSLVVVAMCAGASYRRRSSK